MYADFVIIFIGDDEITIINVVRFVASWYRFVRALRVAPASCLFSRTAVVGI